jgi:hypothetical protein
MEANRGVTFKCGGCFLNSAAILLKTAW